MGMNMIISASRRTDIPARYADWFFNRIKEGFALARNPMNPRRISRVRLRPEDVSGIVFWTKDPRPVLDRLDLLRDYAFYFQFTLTPYAADIEAGLPSKGGVLLPAFLRLSDAIGAERVIWRYDPILINDTYTAVYHRTYFEKLARRLRGHTQTCTISFMDLYRCNAAAARKLGVRELPDGEKLRLAGELREIAEGCGISVNACCETLDLSGAGVGRARCVDAHLLARIAGHEIKAERDPNQRGGCACHRSVDIGQYDTCPNGCAYCYATHSRAAVAQNISLHDPASPLLVGNLRPDDMVADRA